MKRRTTAILIVSFGLMAWASFTAGLSVGHDSAYDDAWDAAYGSAVCAGYQRINIGGTCLSPCGDFLKQGEWAYRSLCYVAFVTTEGDNADYNRATWENATQRDY